jgi:hypothetical protein
MAAEISLEGQDPRPVEVISRRIQILERFGKLGPSDAKATMREIKHESE